MNERGQATVLVLGLALLAFAVAGLAVDGTRAWLLRRTLQNAADGAALAGSSEIDRSAYYTSGGRALVLDPRAGETVASRWLAARGIDARTSVAVSEDRVVVEMRDEVPTSFLGLVGIRTITVAARADASPIARTP